MNIKTFALALAMLTTPVIGSVSILGSQAMAMTSGGGGGAGGPGGTGGEYQPIGRALPLTCEQYKSVNGIRSADARCPKASRVITGGLFN